MNFNYSSEQTSDELLETAQNIVATKPDVIVILDHKPHPLPLLKMVLHYLEKEKIAPRFIFHIFGDFTLYYQNWDKLGKILKNYEVNFVVASERQKTLIDKFLPATVPSYVCPFPVDQNEFFYNPALRNAQRKEWGLTDDDMAYVFTGRLSRQKRIHTLLRAFGDLVNQTKTNKAHLFLYGNTDHIGDQFVGKWEVEGEYFRKINRIYKDLSPEVQTKIHFMGSVPNAELNSVYQGADVLVNLSVHNDEDYGMSVAEAQSCGLPAILTDWGGLAGFENEKVPEATTFIPVKIGKYSKLIRYQSIIEALKQSLECGHSKNREEISKSALMRFDVNACLTKVSQILKKKPSPFTKFTPLFEKIVRRSSLNATPYLTPRKEINNLYREIYSSYVRDH